MLKSVPRYDNKWMKADLQVRMHMHSFKLIVNVHISVTGFKGSCKIQLWPCCMCTIIIIAMSLFTTHGVR